MSRALTSLSALVVIACAAILWGLHASNPLDSDEGLILNGAWNVLNGRRPYVDFFEIIPPGAFYAVAAVWNVFGIGYWAAKIFAVSAVAAGAAGIWASARLLASVSPQRISTGWLIAAPLTFCLLSWSWPVINHNTLNVTLLVWCNYFCMRCVLRASRLDAVVAGVIAGLGAWVLLHRTAVLVAAFATFLVWQRWRAGDRLLSSTVLAFVLAAAALPVTMLAFWDPVLLFDSLIRFPATRYLGVNRVDPDLFVLLVAAYALAVWLSRGVRPAVITWLLVLQAALGVTAMQRPDVAHVSWVAFPLLLLSPWLAAVRGAGKTSPMSAKVLLWACIALVPGLAIPGALLIAKRDQLLVDAPRQLKTLEYVRAHCRERFAYAGPFLPGFYFELRKLNPTPFSILLTDFNTREQFQKARDALGAAPPECVVTMYSRGEQFGHRRDNPVDEFIASNYRSVMTERSLTVWRLKGRPEPQAARAADAGDTASRDGNANQRLPR